MTRFLQWRAALMFFYIVWIKLIDKRTFPDKAVVMRKDIYSNKLMMISNNSSKLVALLLKFSIFYYMNE